MEIEKLELETFEFKSLEVRADFNKTFPSSKHSYFQNEGKCKTLVVKMSFICMRTGGVLLYMSDIGPYRYVLPHRVLGSFGMKTGIHFA